MTSVQVESKSCEAYYIASFDYPVSTGLNAFPDYIFIFHYKINLQFMYTIMAAKCNTSSLPTHLLALTETLLSFLRTVEIIVVVHSMSHLTLVITGWDRQAGTASCVLLHMPA
jgi:hypothetical protein